MTRKKVKLAFITNDSARKATFKKRKKGLMKKVSELSTLCGIDACAIIYSPYETQPEVWPNTLGAQRVLAQFKRMPEMEQSKKMINQESFMRQRIAKTNEQLKKQVKENREKEITEVMYQCLIGKGLQNLVVGDLNDLGWLIDQNLKEIHKRIEGLKKMGGQESVPGVAGMSGISGVAGVSGVSGVAGVSGVSGVAMTGSEGGQDIVGRGGYGRQLEQKPAMDLGMEGLQRPQWFSDWMNNNNNDNPSDHHQQMGFGHGDEAMMQFNDNHSAAMWSSAFFP